MFLDFHLHYSSFFYFTQERKVIMSVNKAKTPTKDGKYWFFRVVYKDEFNTPKRYNSKKAAGGQGRGRHGHGLRLWKVQQAHSPGGNPYQWSQGHRSMSLAYPRAVQSRGHPC